jgi:hypothetical protein
MHDSKEWHVAFTKPGKERKVGEILNRKKIENYCPSNTIVRHWNSQVKLIHVPIFTSFVFVRVDGNEIEKLKRVDGIINIVYRLREPAIVPDSEIERIRQFLTKFRSVKLKKVPLGEEMEAGAVLVTNAADLYEINRKTATIILPSLGYMITGEEEAVNSIDLRDESKQEFYHINQFGGTIIHNAGEMIRQFRFKLMHQIKLMAKNQFLRNS